MYKFGKQTRVGSKTLKAFFSMPLPPFFRQSGKSSLPISIILRIERQEICSFHAFYTTPRNRPFHSLNQYTLLNPALFRRVWPSFLFYPYYWKPKVPAICGDYPMKPFLLSKAPFYIFPIFLLRTASVWHPLYFLIAWVCHQSSGNDPDERHISLPESGRHMVYADIV